MVKMIIAGGGTGGHLFPGIAIAQELKRRYQDMKIFFVGTKRGVESKILPQFGFNLVNISIVGLRRKTLFKNLAIPFHLIGSLFQSLILLNKIKPEVVIGTGGYVSYPVLLLANLKKIPTLIQEQNSYPGMTTRLLAKKASRVCLTYESSLDYFPTAKNNPDKFKVLGNPIREDITGGDKNLALKRLNLSPNKKTIFVFGGSQGAHKINLAILEALDDLKDNIQLLWHSGEKDFAYIKEKTQKSKLKISLHSFINEMGLAYAAADLVVSRAGAIALAEITACAKPSILIPYPFATADHQRLNAEELKKSGAAEMILEKDLSGKKLALLINQLLSDENKLVQMSQASKKMAKLDAASKIVDEIEKLWTK